MSRTCGLQTGCILGLLALNIWSAAAQEDPSITVISPTSDDTVFQGREMLVVIETEGDVSGPYDVELYRGQDEAISLCDSSDAEDCDDENGTISVTVLSSVDVGDGYTVHVTDSDTSTTGVSDVFSIAEAAPSPSPTSASGDTGTADVKSAQSSGEQVGDMDLSLMIIAIICGVCIVGALVAGCVICCRRRRDQRPKESKGMMTGPRRSPDDLENGGTNPAAGTNFAPGGETGPKAFPSNGLGMKSGRSLQIGAAALGGPSDSAGPSNRQSDVIRQQRGADDSLLRTDDQSSPRRANSDDGSLVVKENSPTTQPPLVQIQSTRSVPGESKRYPEGVSPPSAEIMPMKGSNNPEDVAASAESRGRRERKVSPTANDRGHVLGYRRSRSVEDQRESAREGWGSGNMSTAERSDSWTGDGKARDSRKMRRSNSVSGVTERDGRRHADRASYTVYRRSSSKDGRRTAISMAGSPSRNRVYRSGLGDVSWEENRYRHLRKQYPRDRHPPEFNSSGSAGSLGGLGENGAFGAAIGGSADRPKFRKTYSMPTAPPDSAGRHRSRGPPPPYHSSPRMQHLGVSPTSENDADSQTMRSSGSVRSPRSAYRRPGQTLGRSMSTSSTLSTGERAVNARAAAKEAQLAAERALSAAAAASRAADAAAVAAEEAEAEAEADGDLDVETRTADDKACTPAVPSGIVEAEEVDDLVEKAQKEKNECPKTAHEWSGAQGTEVKARAEATAAEATVAVSSGTKGANDSSWITQKSYHQKPERDIKMSRKGDATEAGRSASPAPENVAGKALSKRVGRSPSCSDSAAGSFDTTPTTTTGALPPHSDANGERKSDAKYNQQSGQRSFDAERDNGEQLPPYASTASADKAPSPLKLAETGRENVAPVHTVAPKSQTAGQV